MRAGMELLLIRHAPTAGNLARRYLGRTDEGLCPEGIALAKEAAGRMPPVDVVYISPMRRCRETAELLFPGREPVAVPGLEETDFGAFEYKTYEELKTDPAYCAWLDSGGEGPIPGGEDRQTVERRVLAALDGLLKALPETGRAALVVHGGTIMTILAARGLPERSYYDWQVKTCRGFAVVPENGKLRVIKEL